MTQEEAARKQLALELAVELTARQQVARFDAKVTVEVAEAFENYLNGKEVN